MSGSMYNQISKLTGASFPLVPPTDVHVLPTIPPPPLPQHREVRQVTQFIIDKNALQMSNVTEATGFIMGGEDEPACIRSYNDRKICNVLSKRIIRKSRAVPEPPADTVDMNKADTNAYTCCLGNYFFTHVYINRSADVYPYNDDYTSIEIVPIVSGATASDQPNGTTYILVFHGSLHYGTKIQHILINKNQVRLHWLDFFYNPVFGDELCIELDGYTEIPLQFKVIKCVF